MFLVIALITAFLGFGGGAALSWEGAKILLVIFLVLAVLSFLGYGLRMGPLPGDERETAFPYPPQSDFWYRKEFAK